MTHSEKESKYLTVGTFLVVQWLRHHVFTSGSTDFIPGRGSKIPHAVWHSQKKNKKKKNSKVLHKYSEIRIDGIKLQTDTTLAKLVNIHKTINHKSHFAGHNLRFYRQESFVLLFLSCDLQS